MVNKVIQYNTTKRKASTDFRTYSFNSICQITSISTVRQIEQPNVTISIRTTQKAWTKGYCQSHILWEISYLKVVDRFHIYALY